MYTVDYFIQKFEAIPEGQWCTGQMEDIRGLKCANGHCGLVASYQPNEEALALVEILRPLKRTNRASFPDDVLDVTACINDGLTAEYPQPTPKQRILAALYDIKKIQSKDNEPEQPKERIVYVSVPVSITEQAKELITN